MRFRRVLYSNNALTFVFAFIFFTGAFVLVISILNLPETSPQTKQFRPNYKIKNWGKLVIEMLPENLGFTVFLPSEKAFERDLGLHWNESFVVGEKMNDDSYAILTRVLGFCAIPRMIYSSDLKKNGSMEEVDYDSLDGFTLFIRRRDDDGMVVVNRVISMEVDIILVKKKIVVHVMDGVVMDSEFEQAVLPE